MRADREAIHQVFSNLIDNAMKYGRSGGRIVLGARPARRGIGILMFSDFGAGIASEHLPRLFERFYRVDKARSRESGGTGLGLAIAKHIMLRPRRLHPRRKRTQPRQHLPLHPAHRLTRITT